MIIRGDADFYVIQFHKEEFYGHFQQRTLGGQYIIKNNISFEQSVSGRELPPDSETGRNFTVVCA